MFGLACSLYKPLITCTNYNVITHLGTRRSIHGSGSLVHSSTSPGKDVSNHRNGIWNGTMEWKMEWNGEHTQLQLTRVTGAAQSRLN